MSTTIYALFRFGRAPPKFLVRREELPDFIDRMERTRARILHVDDHQDTRLMMAALLQDCGYGVLTAGSVAEGLDLAKEINFDLYILDVRLPDGTGVELCQRLRELNSKIPILYYSAYGDEADHQNALETCGDAYLKKPVCIADIQETIAELLKKAEAEG